MRSIKKIPIAGPSVSDKEVSYVTDAAKNGWYQHAFDYIHKFEKAFARYIGVKYAVSLPSCTSGIHLALAAMNIKKGDEVIVPDITWIGTSAPVSYVGAKPVFADIDERTWCLSPESFEKAITKKTKAVIPVDLYGCPADWGAINKIAKKHGIKIIEDAAESLGAEYRGKKAGSFGDAAVFSFHGTKTLTTGEGGMLVTNNKRLYERVQILRDHGRQPGDIAYHHQEVAFKYKMSNLQAAFGLAQIERINQIVRKKRQIFKWYKMELALLDSVQINFEPVKTVSTFWMITIILDKKYGLKKEKLQNRFSHLNIDTRPFFYPLSSLKAYKGLKKKYKKLNPVSYKLSPYGINLPSALSLTEADVKRVCSSLRKILEDEK